MADAHEYLVNSKFPEFSLHDDQDNIVTKNNILGQWTVIFFYPKANTPGCTAQACNLSENFSKLKKKGFSIC